MHHLEDISYIKWNEMKCCDNNYNDLQRINLNVNSQLMNGKEGERETEMKEKVGERMQNINDE